MVQTGTGLIEMMGNAKLSANDPIRGHLVFGIEKLESCYQRSKNNNFAHDQSSFELNPYQMLGSPNMRSAWKHLENQLFWIGKPSHWPVVLDGSNGKML